MLDECDEVENWLFDNYVIFKEIYKKMSSLYQVMKHSGDNNIKVSSENNKNSIISNNNNIINNSGNNNNKWGNKPMSKLDGYIKRNLSHITLSSDELDDVKRKMRSFSVPPSVNISSVNNTPFSSENGRDTNNIINSNNIKNNSNMQVITASSVDFNLKSPSEGRSDVVNNSKNKGVNINNNNNSGSIDDDRTIICYNISNIDINKTNDKNLAVSFSTQKADKTVINFNNNKFNNFNSLDSINDSKNDIKKAYWKSSEVIKNKHYYIIIPPNKAFTRTSHFKYGSKGSFKNTFDKANTDKINITNNNVDNYKKELQKVATGKGNVVKGDGEVVRTEDGGDEQSVDIPINLLRKHIFYSTSETKVFTDDENGHNNFNFECNCSCHVRKWQKFNFDGNKNFKNITIGNSNNDTIISDRNNDQSLAINLLGSSSNAPAVTTSPFPSTSSLSLLQSSIVSKNATKVSTIVNSGNVFSSYHPHCFHSYKPRNNEDHFFTYDNKPDDNFNDDDNKNNKTNIIFNNRNLSSCNHINIKEIGSDILDGKIDINKDKFDNHAGFSSICGGNIDSKMDNDKAFINDNNGVFSSNNNKVSIGANIDTYNRDNDEDYDNYQSINMLSQDGHQSILTFKYINNFKCKDLTNSSSSTTCSSSDDKSNNNEEEYIHCCSCRNINNYINNNRRNIYEKTKSMEVFLNEIEGFLKIESNDDDNNNVINNNNIANYGNSNNSKRKSSLSSYSLPFTPFSSLNIGLYNVCNFNNNGLNISNNVNSGSNGGRNTNESKMIVISVSRFLNIGNITILFSDLPVTFNYSQYKRRLCLLGNLENNNMGKIYICNNNDNIPTSINTTDIGNDAEIKGSEFLSANNDVSDNINNNKISDGVIIDINVNSGINNNTNTNGKEREKDLNKGLSGSDKSQGSSLSYNNDNDECDSNSNNNHKDINYPLYSSPTSSFINKDKDNFPRAANFSSSFLDDTYTNDRDDVDVKDYEGRKGKRHRHLKDLDEDNALDSNKCDNCQVSSNIYNGNCNNFTSWWQLVPNLISSHLITLIEYYYYIYQRRNKISEITNVFDDNYSNNMKNSLNNNKTNVIKPDDGDKNDINIKNILAQNHGNVQKSQLSHELVSNDKNESFKVIGGENITAGVNNKCNDNNKENKTSFYVDNNINKYDSKVDIIENGGEQGDIVDVNRVSNGIDYTQQEPTEYDVDSLKTCISEDNNNSDEKDKTDEGVGDIDDNNKRKDNNEELVKNKPSQLRKYNPESIPNEIFLKTTVSVNNNSNNFINSIVKSKNFDDNVCCNFNPYNIDLDDKNTTTPITTTTGNICYENNSEDNKNNDIIEQYYAPLVKITVDELSNIFRKDVSSLNQVLRYFYVGFGKISNNNNIYNSKISSANNNNNYYYSDNYREDKSDIIFSFSNYTTDRNGKTVAVDNIIKNQRAETEREILMKDNSQGTKEDDNINSINCDVDHNNNVEIFKENGNKLFYVDKKAEKLVDFSVKSLPEIRDRNKEKSSENSQKSPRSLQKIQKIRKLRRLQKIHKLKELREIRLSRQQRLQQRLDAALTYCDTEIAVFNGSYLCIAGYEDFIVLKLNNIIETAVEMLVEYNEGKELDYNAGGDVFFENIINHNIDCIDGNNINICCDSTMKEKHCGGSSVGRESRSNEENPKVAGDDDGTKNCNNNNIINDSNDMEGVEWKMDVSYVIDSSLKEINNSNTNEDNFLEINSSCETIDNLENRMSIAGNGMDKRGSFSDSAVTDNFHSLSSNYFSPKEISRTSTFFSCKSDDNINNDNNIKDKNNNKLNVGGEKIDQRYELNALSKGLNFSKKAKVEEKAMFGDGFDDNDKNDINKNLSSEFTNDNVNSFCTGKEEFLQIYENHHGEIQQKEQCLGENANFLGHGALPMDGIKVSNISAKNVITTDEIVDVISSSPNPTITPFDNKPVTEDCNSKIKGEYKEDKQGKLVPLPNSSSLVKNDSIDYNNTNRNNDDNDDCVGDCDDNIDILNKTDVIDEEQIYVVLHTIVISGVSDKLNTHWESLCEIEDIAFFHACNALRRNITKALTSSPSNPDYISPLRDNSAEGNIINSVILDKFHEYLPPECLTFFNNSNIDDKNVNNKDYITAGMLSLTFVPVCQLMDAADIGPFSVLRVMEAIITGLVELVKNNDEINNYLNKIDDRKYAVSRSGKNRKNKPEGDDDGEQQTGVSFEMYNNNNMNKSVNDNNDINNNSRINNKNQKKPFSTSVTADICIPMIALILILTAPHHLPSRIKLALDFIPTVVELSSLGYALSTFEASMKEVQRKYSEYVLEGL